MRKGWVQADSDASEHSWWQSALPPPCLPTPFVMRPQGCFPLSPPNLVSDMSRVHWGFYLPSSTLPPSNQCLLSRISMVTKNLVDWVFWAALIAQQVESSLFPLSAFAWPCQSPAGGQLNSKMLLYSILIKLNSGCCQRQLWFSFDTRVKHFVLFALSSAMWRWRCQCSSWRKTSIIYSPLFLHTLPSFPHTFANPVHHIKFVASQPIQKWLSLSLQPSSSIPNLLASHFFLSLPVSPEWGQQSLRCE